MGLLATEEGIVTNVIDGSESSEAGIRPGMKLVTVNGRRYSRQRFREAIREAAASGGAIDLVVNSQGRETSSKLGCEKGKDLAMYQKEVELRRFSYPPDAVQRAPHHAAVFGPTRWTNLYFPAKFLLWGDLVGGKLHAIFGPGVHDRRVSTRQWLGFLSHTLYWTSHGENQHVAELRTALDLGDTRNGITEN